MDEKNIIVDVKWQKELFKDVSIDLGQPPAVFKMQLFSLTGVPPERQKIMGFKGGLLKDDVLWEKVAPKNGQKVTMMGTADQAPVAPSQPQTFVEDLPEEEQDTTGLSKYGAGLENLGNTCYMNSTLQCLYAVPELRSGLTDVGNQNVLVQTGDATTGIAVAAKNLFSRMERSAVPVSPWEFVLSLRRAFPQFDQTTRDGVPMQQDAEECWGSLMSAFRSAMQGQDGRGTVQGLFGVRTHAVLKCDESGESIEIDDVEPMLKCNITGEVNHLAEGIRLGLQADREQNSAALQTLAKFKGEAKIESLPPYLTVQMVRFFYKADVQQKAKILRKVTFSLVLDLYDLCSERLRSSLDGPRTAFKAFEDAAAGLNTTKRQKIVAGRESHPEGAALKSEAEASSATENGMDTEMAKADKMGPGDSSEPSNRLEYAGEITGKYELIGVLTHKGRSADSGHYVSWVKQEDGQWIQFDDDKMIPRKEEEVLMLSGGGDWHMAYMLLYKAIRVPSGDSCPGKNEQMHSTN